MPPAPPLPPGAAVLQEQGFGVKEIKTTKYANKVRQLSEPDYQALKQSIVKNGLYCPIAVNGQAEILDGHHRFRICQELGIEPRIEVYSFESEIEEELFVYDINLNRRHLTKFERAELVLKEKPLLACACS